MQTSRPLRLRPQSTGRRGGAAYSAGLRELLRLRAGAIESVARVDRPRPDVRARARGPGAARPRAAARRSTSGARLQRRRAARTSRATERERSHVHAVAWHTSAATPRPLIAHLASLPARRAAAVDGRPDHRVRRRHRGPRGGVGDRRARQPAYGDDWWFAGLLAFVRQEQRRFDEAMELSLPRRWPSSRQPATRPTPAPTRTTRPATTRPGWTGWTTGSTGDGAADRQPRATTRGTPPCTSCRWATWTAVRRRYDAQLRPEHGLGCRALVDSGSLLFRWAITPGAERVPDMAEVVRRHRARRARAAGDAVPGHARRGRAARDRRPGRPAPAAGGRRGHSHPQREVVAPLARALVLLQTGDARRPRTRWPGCGVRYPSRWLRRPARAGGGDLDLRAPAGGPVRRRPRGARRTAGPPPFAARPRWRAGISVDTLRIAQV